MNHEWNNVYNINKNLIIERKHDIEFKANKLVTFIHVLFIIILLFIFFFTSFLSLIMSQDTPLSPLNFPHLPSHKVVLIVILPLVVINRCLNRTKLGKHHIHCVSTFGRLRNLWNGWLKINFVNKSTFTIHNYSCIFKSGSGGDSTLLFIHIFLWFPLEENTSIPNNMRDGPCIR